jgi:transposase
LATDVAHECAAGIRDPTNAIEVNGQLLYAVTRVLTLQSRRVYLHVYFDEQRQAAKRSDFMQKLLSLENGLRNGDTKLGKNKTAKKYLSWRKSKNGIHIRRKTQAIEKDTALYGFFVILTNDSKDPRYVLDVYRTKDVIEKSFDNLKNDLDLNRLNVHSEAAMEGRVFLGFISLILSSYIRETMRQNNLYKSFTFSSLLAELKKQKMVHFAGGKTMLTELTKTQRTIFEAFHIPAPI